MNLATSLPYHPIQQLPLIGSSDLFLQLPRNLEHNLHLDMPNTRVANPVELHHVLKSTSVREPQRSRPIGVLLSHCQLDIIDTFIQVQPH